MTVLAAGASTSAWDQPGTLGFLVVFGMGVILYFVFRSMSKHLRRIREAAAREAAASANGQVTGAAKDALADGSASGPRSGGRGAANSG